MSLVGMLLVKRLSKVVFMVAKQHENVSHISLFTGWSVTRLLQICNAGSKVKKWKLFLQKDIFENALIQEAILKFSWLLASKSKPFPSWNPLKLGLRVSYDFHSKSKTWNGMEWFLINSLCMI